MLLFIIKIAGLQSSSASLLFTHFHPTLHCILAPVHRCTPHSTYALHFTMCALFFCAIVASCVVFRILRLSVSLPQCRSAASRCSRPIISAT